MAKKKQFDWKTHSKPVRALSEAQEQALLGGTLRPLLDAALSDPRYRLEIRPRASHLYLEGTSLLRVTGDGPFIAEVDSAGGPAIRSELTDSEASSHLVRSTSDAAGSVPMPRRAVLHALAGANQGTDLFGDELVVIDSEYNVGPRKMDLVALRRSEGVTGPGGFANPVLVFIDVRTGTQPLTGNTGLAAAAADFAEFAKALSGEHLERAKAELAALTAQKVRLGLLPAELELRGFTDEPPELLIVFSEYDVLNEVHDRAMIELAEKLAARHYPAGRLYFAHYIDTPLPGEEGMSLREGEVVSYREFKSYRQAGR